MNKTVIALATTAAALLAGGVHLLLQLDAERTRVVERAPAPAAVIPQEPEPTVAPVANATPVAPPASRTDAHAEQGPAPTDEDRVARQRRQAADYLRSLEDPAGRRDARKRALDKARLVTVGLDGRLHLRSDQYERLVELLADQEMEKRLKSAQCMADPSCDFQSPIPSSAAFSARNQAIRDIVGDAGLREMRKQWVTAVERAVVDGLQARLPTTAALTPAQADDLTRSLFEEIHGQLRDLGQSQQHSVYYGLRDGPVLNYVDDSPTAELALQSGEASALAIRDRAATMLSGEQLIAFNRMYDDLLISFRRHIRLNYQPRARDGDRTP